MIKKFAGFSLVCFFMLGFTFVLNVQAQRSKKPITPKICGDPTKPCKTTAEFEPHDIQFEIPEGALYIGLSERFYAVILKSVRQKNDAECEEVKIPEDERLATQELFPNNKVFSSVCPDPVTLFYEPIHWQVRFMAVYAGKTPAEAAKMLEKVKATGKFPGAYTKRLRAGFNGT